MAKHLFFDASRQTFDQVSELFDFLWPTVTAMWNLRWQVEGYLRIRPYATVEELESRFVLGSEIHGANLRRACAELSWEEQQGEFAKFLLISIFALYESWLRSVLEDLSYTSAEKKLQYPTGMKNGIKSGAWAVIDAITSPESSMLKDAFYDSLILHRKNSRAKLDNLLKCYRYFKECRNCLVHNGGLANAQAEQAYQDFAPIANVADLGVKEIPDHAPIATGDPIRLRLRGIVGFCDIVLRIIATLDAELSRSVRAEKVLHQRWIKALGKRYTLRQASDRARSKQIEHLIRKIGLPTPLKTSEIEQFLLKNGLAR